MLLLRELEERLGLTESLSEELTDPRNPVFVTHPFVELLRTRLYALAQGHKDQDDVDRLRDDPAFRLSVSERRGTPPLKEEEGLVPDGLSSQPTQSRLVATLTLEENLAQLGLALFGWAHRDLRATRKTRARRRVLDVDSLPLEAHGSQPGSARNAPLPHALLPPARGVRPRERPLPGERAATRQRIERGRSRGAPLPGPGPGPGGGPRSIRRPARRRGLPPSCCRPWKQVLDRPPLLVRQLRTPRLTRCPAVPERCAEIFDSTTHGDERPCTPPGTNPAPHRREADPSARRRGASGRDRGRLVWPRRGERGRGPRPRGSAK
ncbi:MAG: hypothetical protein D6731_05665 [Planctomycetota bacterium]|nr:MAG: hypothetical protein D6731_05665 [Planctomycetota bacterium]